jgi:NAD dependent epimerase/dehydratase family enzyme
MPFFFGLNDRISSGEQWFPWIHVDDVAGINAHAVENNNVQANC